MLRDQRAETRRSLPDTPCCPPPRLAPPSPPPRLGPRPGPPVPSGPLGLSKPLLDVRRQARHLGEQEGPRRGRSPRGEELEQLAGGGRAAAGREGMGVQSGGWGVQSGAYNGPNIAMHAMHSVHEAGW